VAGDGERLHRCSSHLQVIGVPGGMIAPPAGARIWIAAGITDLRCGFTGLSAAVQTVLEQDPYDGHVFVFRGRALSCNLRKAVRVLYAYPVTNAGAFYPNTPKHPYPS
jgi:transposase